MNLITNNVELNHVQKYADLLSDFSELWTKTSGLHSGNLNTYELCWVSRVASPEHPEQPLLPHILAIIQARQNPDGSLGQKAPHPFCDVMNCLVYANTLIQWSTNAAINYQSSIIAALNYAETAYHLITKINQQMQSYGQLFQFGGFYGCEEIMLAAEIKLLLKEGQQYLTDQQKTFFMHIITQGKKSASLAEESHIDFSLHDPLAFCFGEYLSTATLTSSHLKMIIQYAYGREHIDNDAINIAFLVKYYNATKDGVALSAIKQYINQFNDGLFAYGRMPEILFALMYMANTGINVKNFFKEQVAYLKHCMRKNGVGIVYGKQWPMDMDTSAVAQYSFNKLSLASPMPTHLLENYWIEFADKQIITSPTLHVLNAYLTASDVTFEQQQLAWRQTINYLEKKTWYELHHLSPFYIWEKIVSIVGEHIAKFSDTTTQVHQFALDAILSSQHPNGGFSSCFVGYANAEETALALLALKSAAASSAFLNRQHEIRTALIKAQHFLENDFKEKSLNFVDYPALWIVFKSTTVSRNTIRAIILSALYK